MQTATVQTKFIKDFSWGRFLLLGLVSLILASSMLLAILVPFPLALVSVLFGRAKAFALYVGCLVVGIFLYQANIWGSEILFVYIGCELIAFILGEILKHNMKPMKAMIISGSSIFILSLSLLLIGASQLVNLGKIPAYENNQELSVEASTVPNLVRNVKTFITLKMKEVGTLINKEKDNLTAPMNSESKDILEVFSHPELVIDEIVYSIPSALFVTIFFGLWINLFFLLRTNRFYHFSNAFTDKDLLNFKVPDFMVWIVVLSLAIVVFGEGYLPKNLRLLGNGLVQCLGLFYFFQGFGIFMEFLDYLKIQGIFRSLLVILTIISGWWIIASVGLFDLWVNFRRFFHRKTQQ